MQSQVSVFIEYRTMIAMISLSFCLFFCPVYPNRDLENDIDSETSSDFKSLLFSLLQAKRNESPTFDPEKVKADALELFHAGEGKFGTEESK